MQKKDYKKSRNSKKGNIIKIIAILAIISLMIFFAFNLALFNIKHIKVNGNKYLKKETIIKESKVKKNVNIFKTKIANIEENLEKNPYIKSAEIKKLIPNTIEIKVLEREKTFLLEHTSIYLLIDGDGVILENLKSRDEKFPLVKGFNVDSIGSGENIFKKDKNKELDTFISESKDLKILSKMDEIDKDFANEVNIKLENEIFVAFGPLSNVKYKLGLLKDIIEDIDKKGIQNGKIIMNRGNHPILIIDD